MKIFLYDNATGQVVVNEPEILLVREFATLWATERNKCSEDPTGVLRLRASRELTYIWLMIDWTSPYSNYTESERDEECKKDAEITEEEWIDPSFRSACRKYREIQDSSRALKLIKSAQGVVDKITDYFDDIDLTERDQQTQKPIYKTKDIMTEMQNVAGVIEQLKILEDMYKKEQGAASDVRGDATPGFMDN